MTRATIWVVCCVVLCAMAVPPARSDDGARGAALFEHCAACHGANGQGNRAYLAPAIAGMSEWHVVAQLQKFRSGLRGTHFDDISGMRMRPMSLVLRTDADVTDVAAHVASLAPVQPPAEVTGGDAERGATLYGPCSGCHGMRGEGVEPISGSPLVHISDWYVLEQLRKFKAGVRGTHPSDPIAASMRPMAMILQEQDMKDIVAYIATFADAGGE